MSWLSTLAGAATSFIPGVGPLLAPVVGGLVGSIGANAGAKAVAGPSNEQKQSFNLLNSAAETGIGLGKEQLSSGNAILNRGLSTLNAPSSYFQAILNGGGDATAALAPDIARIKGANATTFNTAANLSSRGGGRNSVLFNQPFKDESQINALQNQLKAPAAEGLTRIGQIETGAGTNVMGQAAPLIGAGVSAARGTADLSNQFRQQQVDAGKSFAQLLTNLLSGGSNKSGMPGVIDESGAFKGANAGVLGKLFELLSPKYGAPSSAMGPNSGLSSAVDSILGGKP